MIFSTYCALVSATPCGAKTLLERGQVQGVGVDERAVEIEEKRGFH